MSLAVALAEFRDASSKTPLVLDSAQDTFDELCRLYDSETIRIQKAYAAFKSARSVENYTEVKIKGFYPFVKIIIDHDQVNLDPSLAYGRFKDVGEFVLNVSDPHQYNNLLGELENIATNTPNIRFEVGLSDEEIPLHYAMRDIAFNQDAELSQLTRAADQEGKKSNIVNLVFTQRHPELIADYVSSDEPPSNRGLLLPYNGQRMDHAIHQFFYYTRTPWEALQPFVIFSNYNQYIEDIYNHGLAKMFNQSADSNQPEVVAVVRSEHEVQIKPGYENDETLSKIKKLTEKKGKKSFQMPACHVMMSDGLGYSLINTGVAAPNVLTISDLIAAKRSEAWIMAGHSAGIDPTLNVGDYVIADQYFINPLYTNEMGTAFDYSKILPLACQPSSELQRAFETSVIAYAKSRGIDPDSMSRRTAVVSTENRQWERNQAFRAKLQDTNAGTLEMETAFLALKAREQSVPFGAFLKVSDLPHYNRPKTAAAADSFFEEIGPHLGLILESIDLIRVEYKDKLASRKFRPVEGPKAFTMR